ncbi:MAG: Smr/MutS family protein [Paludibacteraceae bacterium]|nr:Smr/MutS family protein [Paludibacteraceae bacterium]
MQIGDTIRFLNAIGGGIVRRMDETKQMAWVEDESGFEIPTPYNQCVVVNSQDADNEYRQSILLGRKGPSMQQLAAKNSCHSAPQQVANGHKEAKKDDQMLIDLHAEQLTSRRDLPASDILALQLAAFRRVMIAEKRNKGKQIIFIHGKGEGVLRAELEKILRKEFQSCRFLDANYQKFSTGALLVMIN